MTSSEVSLPLERATVYFDSTITTPELVGVVGAWHRIFAAPDFFPSLRRPNIFPTTALFSSDVVSWRLIPCFFTAALGKEDVVFALVLCARLMLSPRRAWRRPCSLLLAASRNVNMVVYDLYTAHDAKPNNSEKTGTRCSHVP